MVTQFVPVPPGWVVRFHCESTDPNDPAPYELVENVLGFAWNTGDDGWSADPVVWHKGEPWDAQSYADELGAASYEVVPA